MMIREPAAAGRFFRSDRAGCESDLRQCLSRASVPATGDGPSVRRIAGGIVPHAGWICSGAVAARVIQTIAKQRQPAAIVIFGAIHVPHGPTATLFESGAWETPLGLVEVDARLAHRLHAQTGLLELDPHAHENEHSIEVELPFIQHLMPHSMIVPIMTPPTDKAAAVGAAVGRTCKSYGVDVVFLASTDLTHYGPSYGFTPQGVGPNGLEWARDVNDRRMIDAIRAMKAEQIVGEALANRNACGPGAVAATIAACKAFDATRGRLLEHTTSHEVLREQFADAPRDAVGYAGMVID